MICDRAQRIFDHTKTVRFGQTSNDEMMMGFMMTAEVEEGGGSTD